MSRPQHQVRMLEERAMLVGRIEKLTDFIHNNGLFETLAPDEQQDMKTQLAAMEQYNKALTRRINRFLKDE